MSKLVGVSGLKSLDQFKASLGSSGLVAAKTYSFSARPDPYSVSSGSFANLKLTAEKMVKEQASAKTDLELANSKLKKLTEHIRVLEEKLQTAFNDNAKLKVKHKEDEKLWRGLESKLYSTKTLCDQLTETLQLLADQVQDAEKDKVFFTNKYSEASEALDNLHEQMKSLSLRLESSEETIMIRDKELKELVTDKDKVVKQFRDEQSKFSTLIGEKDNLIKNFEETVAAHDSTIESLNSNLKELQLDLRSKEHGLDNMQKLRAKMEEENIVLIASNRKFSEHLDVATQEIQRMEDFVNMLTVKLTELDKQSLTLSEKADQAAACFDSCFEMVQQEKKLATQKAQRNIDQLHDQFLRTVSENDTLQLINQELKNKVNELQKDQECTTARHAEECQLAGERIRRLESEAETLLSKKVKMDDLITTLEDKIGTLSEASKLSQIQMQDLQLKLSEAEVESKENSKNLQSEIQGKQEEIDILQKENVKHEQHLDSLENQLNQLHSMLEEKEHIVVELRGREKQLEDQNAEIQKLLAEAESNVTEAKKQYDQMLESKQLELSRHLKDLSQKNDQAINEIRKKYEVEKQECINLEKEKAEKVVVDMEKKCDLKLAECKEESKKQLMQIEGEHAALVSRMQQENDKKEAILISNHREELKCVQLQADELREKTKLLKNEHEAELRDMRAQHEEECRHLEEELNIQKSKEERQRALLQLQWKVMSDEPQEDQEVTSRKNYSVSSKLRDSDAAKRSNRTRLRGEDEEKELPNTKVSQSPVSKVLKKAEKGNTGSVLSIPKHSKKVTHHEYEVETSHGRTITKRRKTKSTIMFQDPTKNKRRTPKANTPREVIKRVKGGSQQNPINIGDLFSEGSLNPYAEDPYAFD